MSTEDIDPEGFRDLLESRRAVLQETRAQAETGARTVELDQTRVGRLSRMDALQAQQMNIASRRRLEHDIAAVDAALARIESGDYGLCQHCDEPIHPHRLEIDPVAVLCIQCASEQERSR